MDFSALLTPTAIAMIMGIIGILAAVKKAFPELQKKGWWRRLLPFLPLALGVGAAFVLRAFSEEMTPEECLSTGLAAGFVAAQGRKIFKQSFRGQFKQEDA